jgi:hypothetical protein
LHPGVDARLDGNISRYSIHTGGQAMENPKIINIGQGSTSSINYMTITGTPGEGGTTELTITTPPLIYPEIVSVFAYLYDLQVESSKSLKDTYVSFQFLVNDVEQYLERTTIHLGTVSENKHRMRAGFKLFNFNILGLNFMPRDYPQISWSVQWMVSDPNVTLSISGAYLYAIFYNKSLPAS